MKHQLSLELPDTNNTKILRIFDTSVFAPEIPVKCGTLSITSPGFSVPALIEVTPGFNLILTACKLGLGSDQCFENMACLSDGIYTVNFSVSPNDRVYVEYNHLRITETLNEYFGHLCQLEIAACDPSSEVKAKLKELRLIKSLLEAAKVKVEYCNSPIQGLDIFHYAQKKLKAYTGCKNC